MPSPMTRAELLAALRTCTGGVRARLMARGWGELLGLVPSMGERSMSTCLRTSISTLQRLAAGETMADVARTYAVDATTIGRSRQPFRARRGRPVRRDKR